MKIMLDCSPRKIEEYSKRYDYEFWQLRTPLTGNRIAGVPYGLDNGCFTEFREDKWKRMIDEALENPELCKFVTMPDCVGDAMRTKELFEYYFDTFPSYLPKALVLQDGIGHVPVKWHWVKAVFVGGSDAFKISPECINACKVAKMMGKWVHVGRVNTASRIKNYVGIADSIDGSGISRFDHMLENVLSAIRDDEKQICLLASN